MVSFVTGRGLDSDVARFDDVPPVWTKADPFNFALNSYIVVLFICLFLIL